MGWFIRETYIRRARKFLRKHPEILMQYQKTLELLELNPFHPSLRLHHLKGRLNGLSSVSINISYLKASTADAVRSVRKTGERLFITQNGEVRIVVQDIISYEETQQTLALLKILALGEAETGRGETVSLSEATGTIRLQIDK